MLKNKKVNYKFKKENVTINTFLVITTRSQVFEPNALKEKEMKRNNTITN